MPRGRPLTPAAEAVVVEVNREAVDAAGGALTVMQKRSLEISERFGDGLPYSRERLVSEARFFMAQSAEAMLEAGKRLVQLKENEPHGEFELIVDRDIGIAPSVARRMMQAAVKYLGGDLLGAAPRAGLGALGKAKLYELMLLDDDQLDELGAGGTVAGLQVDELRAMSQRELRSLVRELRVQTAAKDKVIASKDRKLNSLAEQLERPFQLSVGSAAKTAEEQALLDSIQAAAIGAQMHLLQLAALVRDLDAGNASEGVQLAAHTSVQYLAQILADAIAESGIRVDFAEMVEPEWLKKANAKLAEKKALKT